jgi:hypothetical protein
MEFTSRANRIGHQRRSDMELRVYESAQAEDLRVSGSVRVNVAAFTGARLRSGESIPCDLLETDTDKLLVRTRFPQRVFTMWVSKEWIDEEACLN